MNMKYYGKLSAAAAAGLMALGTLGASPVFADGETTPPPTVNNGQTVPFTKTVTAVDGIKPSTDETFEFTIAPGEVAENQAAGPGEEFAGITDGMNTTITATTEDGEKFTGNIDFSGVKFSHPGIYVYTLTETSKKGNGFTDPNETEQYIVKVTVVNGETDGTYQVLHATANKDGSAKVEAIAFDAQYDPGMLTITKKIDGNQAYAGDGPFQFELRVAVGDKDGDIQLSETKTGEIVKSKDEENNSYVYTFWLEADEKLEVKGLDSDNTYTLTETNAKGYDNTKNGTEGVVEGRLSPTADNSGAIDNATITYTNKKEGVVPTGIIMTAAPYAGLVGLGGLFAGLFFRRKRED